MAVYPTRTDLPWDDVEGRVCIALPRRRSRAEALLQRVLPTPANVLLTFEGTAARFWRLADGTRRLDDIAREIQVDEPDATRLDERVHEFAHRLARKGLLTLPTAPSPAPDTRRGLGSAQGFRQHACRRCARTIPLRAPPGAWFLCPTCKRLNRLPRT